MPEIPKSKSFGFVSPKGATPQPVAPGGEMALNSAMSSLGKGISEVAGSVLEHRTRAQAKDFIYDKTLSYAKDLDVLKQKLTREYPDGHGYSEAFKEQADQIRGQYGDEASNDLQADMWKSQSNDMFSRSYMQATSDENIRIAEVAVNRVQTKSNEFGKYLVDRPSEAMALQFANTNEKYINEDKDLYNQVDPKTKEKLKKESGELVMTSMVNGFAFKEQYAEGLRALANPEVARFLDATTLDKLKDMLNKGRDNSAAMNISSLRGKVKDLVDFNMSGEASKVETIEHEKRVRAQLKPLLGMPKYADFAVEALNQLNNSKAFGTRAMEIAETPTSQLQEVATKISAEIQSNAETFAKDFPGAMARTGSKQLLDFTQSAQFEGQMNKKLGDIVEERRKDGVGYILSKNEGLENLRKQAMEPGPQGDAARDEYYGQITAKQKLLGMDTSQTLALFERQQVAQELMQPANKAIGINPIQGIQARYGEYTGRAITEALQTSSKLPSEFSIVAKIKDPRAQSALVDTIQNKKLIDTQFTDSKFSEQGKTIDQVVANKVQGILDTTASINAPNANIGFTQAIQSAVTVRTKELVMKGESQSKAVDQAYKEVFSDNFDLLDSGNSKVIVSKGAADIKAVDAFLEVYTESKALASLDLKPGKEYIADVNKRIAPQLARAKLGPEFDMLSPSDQQAFLKKAEAEGLPEAQYKNMLAADISKSSRWITNESGDGLRLIVDTPSGPLPLGVEKTFDEIGSGRDPFVNAKLNQWFPGTFAARPDLPEKKSMKAGF